MPMIPVRALSALVAVSIAFPFDEATSQDPVTKPPTRTPSGIRLPGPRTVVGRQLEDGRIEVRWSGVPGAARYDILRSSPNIGNTVIKPGSTDTVYIDSDIRAGNYYYYVVQAIDSTGYPGLKAGANAVQAKISATTQTLRPTTTGEETAAGGGSTGWSVIKSVRLEPWYWHDRNDVEAMLSVDFSQGGVSFIIERAESYPQKGAWQTVSTSRVARPCCSFRSEVNVGGFTEGARLVYRVTAVDTANPARKSVPVTSNEYTVSYVQLPAPARFTATQQADGTVRLTWGRVAGADHYDLKATTQDNYRIAQLAPSDTTWVDHDIIAGNVYAYTLSARRGYVEGLRSNITIRSTLAAPTPLIVTTGATHLASVAVNESRTISLPSFYTFTTTRWMSLDDAVATVDASGRVTGRSPGTARVFATGVEPRGRIVVVPVRVSVTSGTAPASPPD